MKPQNEVIQEFNVQNNMTVDELQAWLNNPQSKKAGTGVGIESGNKIVEILKKNPSKDPELYDDVNDRSAFDMHRCRLTTFFGRRISSICAK